MKQKLTSCLGCCGFDAWKIGLREPFSGGKFSIKGGRSGSSVGGRTVLAQDLPIARQNGNCHPWQKLAELNNVFLLLPLCCRLLAMLIWAHFVIQKYYKNTISIGSNVS
jgi:hypothetical protein